MEGGGGRGVTGREGEGEVGKWVGRRRRNKNEGEGNGIFTIHVHVGVRNGAAEATVRDMATIKIIMGHIQIMEN